MILSKIYIDFNIKKKLVKKLFTHMNMLNLCNKDIFIYPHEYAKFM